MKRKLLTLVFIVSGLMPAIAQNVSDLKTEKIWIGLNYVKRIIPLYSVAKP